jgi:trans-2-enoyl-CoA reductase
MGVKTINIIRHREDVDILIHDLKALGADHVLVDTAIPESLKGLDVAAPVLGLNCVGGRSSMSIARLLADDSCMVTYGGMSRKPVQVPTGKLIFNDISARGFWLSRWTQKHSEQERMDMIKDLGKMVADGRMKYPMEFFSFGNNFHDAIIRARQGFRSKKVLFKFGNNKRNVDYL